jgi:hypothetical protein
VTPHSTRVRAGAARTGANAVHVSRPRNPIPTPEVLKRARPCARRDVTRVTSPRPSSFRGDGEVITDEGAPVDDLDTTLAFARPRPRRRRTGRPVRELARVIESRSRSRRGPHLDSLARGASTHGRSRPSGG